MGLKDILETMRNHQTGMYDRHVRETLGRFPVGGVVYSDVKRLYVSLISERGLAISSIKQVNMLLHGLFSMALRDGLISKNPTDGVLQELSRYSHNRNTTDRVLVLSHEEENAFMNYIARSSRFRRWFVMFTVLFGTGMRIGEATGITWMDCDFSKSIISVHRSLVYTKGDDGKCRFTIHPTKTEAGERDIPMLADVKVALQNEYAGQTLTNFCPTKVDGVSGFVFWKDGGGLYQKGEVDRAIDTIRESYNVKELENAQREGREPILIPHFSCHSIRHTFISRLVESGANIKAVQDIAGHSSSSMTLDVYAESSERSRAEAMKGLENMRSIG